MCLIVLVVKYVSLITGDVFSCDVEEDGSNNRKCRLRQDTTDDFDWTCNRGKTPSSRSKVPSSRPRNRIINKQIYPVTGPASAKSGKNYLYAGTPGKGTSKVARQACVLLIDRP